MNNKKLFTKALAAALAAAMAVGCAMPALAEAAATKDETVYVVLNSDGSLKSQTVSDHLHSDSGLAGVQDQSTLKNIQNTQSDATYTQDGTTLVWDTTDTDVYYKGETDATPPITASISYQLDGKHLTAEQLAGQSGHLTIQIALANSTLTIAEVGEGENKKTRTVCTPFAAVVGTVLDSETFTNVSAEHGLVQSDGGSTIVGFATLPGVKGCVSDLMPDQLSKLTDALLDTVSIEADVQNCTVPGVMIACAADASLLKSDDGDDLLSELDDLDDLQDDLDKLTDAMDQLLDGAGQLNDGAGDLRDGAKTLTDGTATLYDGTNTLKDGTTTLKDGTTTLKSGTTTLLDGANTLNNGAGKLVDGAGTLKDGTGKLRSGAGTLKSGADTLSSGLVTLSDGLNTLSANNDALNAGAQKIANAVLATANTQLKAKGVIADDMTWATYADVLAGVLGVNDAMRAAARAQLAETVKAKTGTALTDEQLNCLIYMTATAMGADGNLSLDDAVAAAGAEMTRAAADAAGVIGTAQKALADAGNNPVAVPQVNAALESLAVGSILEQIAAKGVDEATAKQVLILAAESGSTDLEAALNAEAAALGTAAAVKAAQAELTAAGGSALGVADVKNLIDTAYVPAAYSAIAAQVGAGDEANALIITMAAQAMAADATLDLPTALANAGKAAATGEEAPVQAAQAALAAAGGDATAVPEVLALLEKQAVATIYGQINAGDDATNALLLTLAAKSVAAGTAPDLTSALSAAATAAQNAQAAQTALAGAQAELDAAGGQLLGVAAVKNAVDAGPVATAYNTVAAKVTTQTGVDNAATIALLVTMAAQSMAADGTTDMTAALAAAGKTLTNANTVQTAMTAANSGNAEADALIKAFLTSLVKKSSADSLKEVDELNTSLAGVQGFVVSLKKYTDGVATAATGAAAAKKGSAELAAGAGELRDGTVKADDGAGELKDGLDTLKNGTTDLLAGVNKLDGGATDLDSGATKLANGAADLQDGAKKLNDGAQTLYDGTGDLKSGTTDLLDGVNKLNNEGVSKLTDSVDLDGLETLKAVMTEMKNRQDAFTGYTGTPDGITTGVKFVMKTAETTAAADTTTVTEAPAAEKTTLWQRILALFGLGKKK